MSQRPEYFYFSTIKNIITAFGIIFRDVVYINDFGDVIKVPLHYSPREKFIEYVEAGADYELDLGTQETLPRMGFEMTSMDYDSLRALNPMSKIRDVDDKDNKYMFNRMPYTFMFNLYIATRKFEDSLKIIEQIVPFFTPELNLSIRDKADFGLVTDVPFVLNNAGFTIDWQGNFETKRTVQWDLNFTAKAWLYSNVRERARIKETIFEMGENEFNSVFATLVESVEPITASKNENHEVEEKSYSGQRPPHLTIHFRGGEMGPFIDEIEKPNPSFYFHFLEPIATGSTLSLPDGLECHLPIPLELSTMKSGEILNSQINK